MCDFGLTPLPERRSLLRQRTVGDNMVRAFSCVVRSRWLALTSVLLLVACSDDDGGGPTGPQLQGRPVYAVTLDNRLLYFGSDAPGTILRETGITGLPAGARIVSIDFRPADGRLYGVGTDSRVYTINVTSAAATAVGAAFAPALDGTHFGLAFDPVMDVIRTSSSEAEQNLRVDPGDGTLTAVDASFAFAAGDVNDGTNPSVAGLAYTNSTPGAASTAAYGIDSNNDVLVTFADPNSGVLTTVGPLGVNTVPCASIDIDASDGTAYVTLADGGITNLYSINLATGGATLIGRIDVDSEVQGIAFAP